MNEGFAATSAFDVVEDVKAYFKRSKNDADADLRGHAPKQIIQEVPSCSDLGEGDVGIEVLD